MEFGKRRLTSPCPFKKEFVFFKQYAIIESRKGMLSSKNPNWGSNLFSHDITEMRSRNWLYIADSEIFFFAENAVCPLFFLYSGKPVLYGLCACLFLARKVENWGNGFTGSCLCLLEYMAIDGSCIQPFKSPHSQNLLNPLGCATAIKTQIGMTDVTHRLKKRGSVNASSLFIMQLNSNTEIWIYIPIITDFSCLSLF